MDTGDGIRLRERDDGWEAVDEDSGLTGRGESAQEALAVLEARLETRGDEGVTEGSGDTTGEAPSTAGTPDTADGAPEPSTAVDGTDDAGLVDIEGMRITISPKVELLFGAAAAGVGAVYLLAGNTGGVVLVAIGAMLLVRVAWIEYGLVGR